MSKIRPLSPISVAAARRVLAAADVQDRRDVDIERIAMRNRAVILYEPVTTARGAIVRTQTYAVILVDVRTKGTPRGLFTAAHELSHHAMHPLVDHFRQCDGETEKRSGTQWRIEEEASHCSAEILMHEPFVLPFCTAPRPTVDDVASVCSAFGTSFHASTIRYVQLTQAACAVARIKGTRIDRSSETQPFPGRIIKGREVHAQSLAAALVNRRVGKELGPREVPGAAWGGTEPFIEHAIHMGDSGILSWIIPAS